MCCKAPKAHNAMIIVLALASLTSVRPVLGNTGALGNSVVPVALPVTPPVALPVALPLVVLAPALALFPPVGSPKAGFALVPSTGTSVPSLTTSYRLWLNRSLCTYIA